MIEVKNLTKKYGDHIAVSDLSFSVGRREIYGFLGSNGAGKSTTMNIIAGCLAATSGSVTVDGYDIFEHPLEAKKRIGYLPEIPPLYLNQTPREMLNFVADAKGVPTAEKKQQILHVMEMTGILDMSDRLCGNLSKGYRQRVGIAQAILGNPGVIILDEPTAGLDPIQIMEIRDLIRTLGAEHTVILSSHILSEVQTLCSRVVILSKGRLAACDTIESLEQRFALKQRIELTAEAMPKDIEKILRRVDGIPDFCLSSLDTEIGSQGESGKTRSMIRMEMEEQQTEQLMRNLFFAFGAEGVAITRMEVKNPSLEELFVQAAE